MNVIPRPRLIKVVFLLLLPALSALAQSDPVDCPQIRINVPSRVTQAEDKALIAVALSGGSVAHSSLSFEWFASAGKIVKGERSETVEILTEERNAGTNINVALRVHGLPKECSAWAVAKFGVAPDPIGEPVDQFRESEGKKDRYFLERRLDNYFAEITNNPGYEGFVTIEFNKKGSLANKIVYLQRIYRHLAFRKFDLARLTFAIADVDHETITTLWTMHPEAKMPKYARNYRIIKAENYRNRLNCIFPLD